MIAGIYGRKSTEQNGAADDQKSVARQIAARQYAQRKGWVVDDDSIFVDDGISGAEFATRPGFLRMMNSLKPRPPFQALITSEESRLGREQLEVGYALKQIISAGVRVFSTSKIESGPSTRPGFGRCDLCRGGMPVRTRSHGRRRAFFTPAPPTTAVRGERTARRQVQREDRGCCTACG